MSNFIERFKTSERVLHWVVTCSFFTLLLSGLGLFSRLFNGYFNLFGGGSSAILVHKIAGVVFFASSVYMFLNHKKDVTTFDEDDKAWIDARGGYLSREERHFNIGKYNPGQKLFAIFIYAATITLGVTGIMIWMPLTFPRWLVQISLMLHGLMFVGSIMFVIVHVYLATIGNPGTIEAMLYGDVRRIWARKHHPKWYKEVGEDNP
ncbi:formate dehydrogenase, cytochrome b556(fdo) subunit [Geobacter sp. OR-1]|uniref:formate dehydrogenase subunit gamma n=1 Tax=Geobacter sp. OR-1 TaxID=1266765 RepID=UPI000542980E|nr:formate dehydrogenase subunit gamma [Geobacter sp. OR-1]GAM09611.1 formate dehydrogenase, cytochrome b556(fdo) subunit [Geobacter sp. OR-1]